MTEQTSETTQSEAEAPKAKARKKAPKAAKKTESGGANGELRPLQIRVLQALNRSSSPLSRTKLYDELGFKAQSGLNDVLGKNDLKARARADKEKYPCLLTLDMVELVELNIHGRAERVYQLTPKGKKAAKSN
mgnify:CR=1 FL=1